MGDLGTEGCRPGRSLLWKATPPPHPLKTSEQHAIILKQSKPKPPRRARVQLCCGRGCCAACVAPTPTPPQHAPSTRTHLEADRLQKLHRAGHDRDARLERRVAKVDAAELLLVGRARDVAFYLNFEFEMF